MIMESFQYFDEQYQDPLLGIRKLTMRCSLDTRMLNTTTRVASSDSHIPFYHPTASYEYAIIARSKLFDNLNLDLF